MNGRSNNRRTVRSLARYAGGLSIQQAASARPSESSAAARYVVRLCRAAFVLRCAVWLFAFFLCAVLVLCFRCVVFFVCFLVCLVLLFVLCRFVCFAVLCFFVWLTCLVAGRSVLGGLANTTPPVSPSTPMIDPEIRLRTVLVNIANFSHLRVRAARDLLSRSQPMGGHNTTFGARVQKKTREFKPVIKRLAALSAVLRVGQLSRRPPALDVTCAPL